MQAFFATSTQKACGTCTRMLAPSPVLGSLPSGTAVVAVFEHLDISAQNGVRGSFPEVGDKTDAGGITLNPRS